MMSTHVKSRLLVISLFVVSLVSTGYSTSSNATETYINRRKSADKIHDKTLQYIMSAAYTPDGPDEFDWPALGQNVRGSNLQFTIVSDTTAVQGASGDYPVDAVVDLEFSIDMQLEGGPNNTYTGLGTMHVIGTGVGSPDDQADFDLEMLAFNMSGELLTTPPTPFLIRESPVEFSTVTTTLVTQPDDTIDGESIAEFYLELSLDGGQTWTAAQTVVPEPTTALLAITGLILAFRRHR